MLLITSSSFAYFQVFLSFLLAAALYDIAKGLANYFKARNHPDKNIKWCSSVTMWQTFVFLVMLQFFLALERSIEANIDTPPVYVVTYVIAMFCLVLLTHLIVPDLNAQDVQEAMKQSGGYDMKHFYRRHRKTLAVVALIFLVMAAINYGHLNGSHENYVQDRAYLHIPFIAMFAVIFFSSEKHEFWFTLIHRVCASMGIVLILLMIIFSL